MLGKRKVYLFFLGWQTASGGKKGPHGLVWLFILELRTLRS